jgi:hypothetical protein
MPSPKWLGGAQFNNEIQTPQKQLLCGCFCGVGTRSENRAHNYPLGVFIGVRAYLRVGDFLVKQA